MVGKTLKEKNILLSMVSWRQRVRDLEAENKFLREEIAKLKCVLKAFDNAHTPSSKQRKKNTEKKEEENKPRFPGKPPGSKGGGIKLPPPDKIVEHTLDKDPKSGQALGEPIGYRKKTIIDFPDKSIEVVEHRIMQYISPITGKMVEKEVKLSNNIYGPNLRAIVTMLKNLTNSHEKIADFLRELGAPSFSTENSLSEVSIIRSCTTWPVDIYFIGWTTCISIDVTINPIYQHS